MPSRILLVDDEPNVVKLLTMRLKLSGYDVITANNGQEGLEKAQQEKPDLIILDLMMPQLNGYEVCMMLKQDTRYRKVPIIVLSAKAQERDKQLGKECGSDAFLSKPYQPEALLSQIKALLPPS